AMPACWSTRCPSMRSPMACIGWPPMNHSGSRCANAASCAPKTSAGKAPHGRPWLLMSGFRVDPLRTPREGGIWVQGRTTEKLCASGLPACAGLCADENRINLNGCVLIEVGIGDADAGARARERNFFDPEQRFTAFQVPFVLLVAVTLDDRRGQR